MTGPGVVILRFGRYVQLSSKGGALPGGLAIPSKSQIVIKSHVDSVTSRLFIGCFKTPSSNKARHFVSTGSQNAAERSIRSFS